MFARKEAAVVKPHARIGFPALANVCRNLSKISTCSRPHCRQASLNKKKLSAPIPSNKKRTRKLTAGKVVWPNAQ
jgi:hypothetical protein